MNDACKIERQKYDWLILMACQPLWEMSSI